MQYDAAVSLVSTPTLLVLCLGLPGMGPHVAYAQPAEVAELAQDPAVQVQKHQAFINVYRTRAQGSLTWTVSVLDPERANGTPAPPELDGATSQGASIRFGELRVPSDLSPGAVLTFQGPLKLDSGAYAPSGRFATVPGQVIERAELVVKSSGAPLSVWTDDQGQAEWSSPRFNELRVVWRDLDENDAAEAVWSASDDWLSAGKTLQRQVESLLTSNIGRNFTRELAGYTATSATEAVFESIKLVSGPDVGWSGRPAARVIAEGSGTRSERGLVLLSVLRAAGYDPIPGLYRPGSSDGTVPTSIAVPSMLQRPVIAVPMGDHMLWIDPGAEWVKLPALPSELSGAIAWLPGDLPRQVVAQGSIDGTVSISGEVNPERLGSSTFNLTITATGAARESLRQQLSTLDEKSREAWFQDLVAQAHPDLSRLTLTVSGVRAADRPLSITARGQLGKQVEPITQELYKTPARTVLAPSLAIALPPRISIREEISIPSPPGTRLLTVARAPTTTDPSAIISQRARREAERITLVTEIERPDRHLASGDARRANAALTQATASGPTLLHLTEASPRAARKLRSASLPASERVALEALILYRAARTGPTRRTLKRYIEPIGIGPLYEQLSYYDAPSDLTRELIGLAKTDDQRMATVPILEAMGRRQEAWELAAEAAGTQIHHVRVLARLAMVRLQPESPPDAAKDPEGAERWKDPMELLQEAAASAERAGAAHPDLSALVLAARGRLLLKLGQSEEAELRLADSVAQSNDPLVILDLAQAQIANNAPIQDVRANLDAAIKGASANPEVYGRAADTLSRLGDTRRAARHAMTAARLAATDTLAWSRATQMALADGDLVGALGAARRASDLEPTRVELASELTRLAILARQDEMAAVGLGRGGESPGFGTSASAMELIGEVPEHEFLAVLRHHDEEVTADPGLLSLRAELELASGDRVRAVRDGTLLAARHNMARGTLVAHGASIGAVWNSTSSRALDSIVTRDPAARAARVEARALLGERIDYDLRQMRGDPRARIWQLALTDPEALAAEDESWSPGLAPRESAPRGFSPNKILGSVKGVSAWSSTLTGQALIRHTGEQDLPPPLSLLYTVEEPALERLPSGGRVVSLSGGALPLYAAIRIEDKERIVGLGHTSESAKRALAKVVSP
ncbi:MAG: hypothetical protein EA397_19135 [Deltaproteobacteria bacterium]|nr:MAG: hypothetical protein EA397_19135 [Deltaproteobacteria bacterium]